MTFVAKYAEGENATIILNLYLIEFLMKFKQNTPTQKEITAKQNSKM